jgi:cullin 3
VPAAAFEVFKNFYLGKHTGRVLTLQPSAGTADLNAVFFQQKRAEGSEAEGQRNVTVRKHILCVNTYQVMKQFY